jgi:hypothetical protein
MILILKSRDSTASLKNLIPESFFNLDSRFRGNDVWIPAFAGTTSGFPPTWERRLDSRLRGNDGKKVMTERKGMTKKKRYAFVILAVPPVIFAVSLVIPAEAGIQATGLTGWIPTPHLRGDMLTPAGTTSGFPLLRE